MADRQIRFGIIGAGEILQSMKRVFIGNSKLRAVAVADTNEKAAEALAGELGAAAYDDYRKVLAEASVEAVYIATPPFLHKQMVMDAMVAGKHMVCEKPFAMNGPDVQEIGEAARKTNLKVCCCSSRFVKTPSAAAAKKLIDENALGDLRTLTLVAATPGAPGPKTWTGWKAERKCAGGGLIMDWGVYDLDWMFHILGESFRPRQVFATTRDICGDVESSFAITIVCKNGLRIDWQRRNAEIGPAKKAAIEIRGTKAGMDLSMIPSDVPAKLFTMPGGALETRQIADAWTDWGTCGVLPVQDLAESILENREPLSGIARQLQIQQVIDAVYQSVQTGRAIEIQPLLG